VKSVTTVLATSLAIAAASLAAGCGSSEDATTRSASASPVPIAPPWNCSEGVYLDDELIKLDYINKSSQRIVLRADQPKDCAPWGSSLNPGQVNATGAVEPGASQLVTLAYDGLTDEPGKTVATPVRIAIRVLGATPSSWSATTPDLVLVRTVDGSGRYTRRNLFLRRDGRDSCTGGVPINTLSPPKLVGVFDCRGDEQYSSEPPAELVINDAPG
jgi:hypothetical protein